MIEDKLTHAERRRVEAMAQAISFYADGRGSQLDIIDLTVRFEEFIAKANSDCQENIRLQV